MASGADCRAAGSVIARDARIEQSAVRMLVANQVHAERTTGVLVLIARKVEGVLVIT